MPTPTFTVQTSDTDPADTLQITATIPSTEVIFSGSIKSLQARIAAYDPQIAKLQAEKTADEALLVQLEGVLTNAGVVDVSAPTTPEQVTAIAAQNDAANQTALQAQSDEVSTKLATLQSAQLDATPVETVSLVQ